MAYGTSAYGAGTYGEGDAPIGALIFGSGYIMDFDPLGPAGVTQDRAVLGGAVLDFPPLSPGAAQDSSPRSGAITDFSPSGGSISDRSAG